MTNNIIAIYRRRRRKGVDMKGASVLTVATLILSLLFHDGFCFGDDTTTTHHHHQQAIVVTRIVVYRNGKKMKKIVRYI